MEKGRKGEEDRESHLAERKRTFTSSSARREEKEGESWRGEKRKEGRKGLEFFAEKIINQCLSRNEKREKVTFPWL